MKVKNISTEAQHFAGIGTFEPDQVMDVSEATADILLRSPFIQKAEKGEKFQAKDTAKSMRGVERD